MVKIKELPFLLWMLSLLSCLNLIVAAQITKNWFFHGDVSTDNLVFSFHVILDLSPVCLFVVPLLGLFSDIYPRKTILLIVCITTLIAFTMSFFSIQSHIANLYLLAVLMLAIIRCVIPLLFATMAEHSHGQRRYQLFGLLSLSIMFFDPPDEILHEWIKHTFSLPIILGISTVSSLIMVYLISRWYPKNAIECTSVEHYLDNFLHHIKRKSFILQLAAMILFVFSWGIFEQDLIPYLTHLHWSTQQITSLILNKYLISITGFFLIIFFTHYAWQKIFVWLGFFLSSSCLIYLSYENTHHTLIVVIGVFILFPIIFLNFINQMIKNFQHQLGLILTLLLGPVTAISWTASAVTALGRADSYFMLAGLLLLLSAGLYFISLKLISPNEPVH